jgi:pimeloyl-ACP methyl ester carboxylesterase
MSAANAPYVLDEALLERLRRGPPDTVIRVRHCHSTETPIHLAYQTFGDPSHPCMLLVMGLNSSLAAWDDDFCRQLAACGFFVVRFDNRDVGLSTKLDHRPSPGFLRLLLPRWLSVGEQLPYTLLDMVDDTVALLDALRIEAAHVVGVSMGGMLAQQLAISYPRRVLSLTSIMSHTGSQESVDAGLAAKRLFLLSPKSRTPHHLAEFRTDWILKLCGTDDVSTSRAYTRAFFVYTRSSYGAGMPRQAAALTRAPCRLSGLRKLTVPTLVIHGDADILVPVENGYQTAAAVPSSKLVIVPGMGHVMLPKHFDLLASEIVSVAQRAMNNKSNPE